MGTLEDQRPEGHPRGAALDPHDADYLEAANDAFNRPHPMATRTARTLTDTEKPYQHEAYTVGAEPWRKTPSTKDEAEKASCGMAVTASKLYGRCGSVGRARADPPPAFGV